MLVFTTQPGNATAGSIFGTQPVVKSQDLFGNNSTVGLPSSLSLSLSLNQGSGPLQGTPTQDIGTGAGNGTISFADLQIDAAGTNKQLTASANGLSSGSSSLFSVNPSTATSLAIQTQPPSAATAGAVFSPASVIRLLDTFGNLLTTDNSTVVSATRSAGTASLQGTTSLAVSGGLATFSNLSYNTAENITFAFGVPSVPSIPSLLSSTVTVGPPPPTRLPTPPQPP